MKKKVIIVFLLVAIMVLSVIGCNNASAKVEETTPTEETVNGKLQFEMTGTYSLSKVGAESVIYSFKAPNDDIVVYEMPGPVYMVAENAGKRSVRYAIKMIFRGSEFVALSNKYILLNVENEKIAVSIEGEFDANSGISLLEEYPFNELSDKEKEAFVYPAKSKKVTK